MKVKASLYQSQTPDRQKVIDKCQVELWKLRKEIQSYSVLFRHLSSSKTVPGAGLYGGGIGLKRISARLDGINVTRYRAGVLI